MKITLGLCKCYVSVTHHTFMFISSSSSSFQEVILHVSFLHSVYAVCRGWISFQEIVGTV